MGNVNFWGTSSNDEVLGENCLNTYIIMIWITHGTNVDTIHLLLESLTQVKGNKSNKLEAHGPQSSAVFGIGF